MAFLAAFGILVPGGVVLGTAPAAAWGGYSNGQIPSSALSTLSWAPAHMLEPAAASWFEQLNAAYRARFGVSIPMTDSYRTYAQQVALYQQKPHLAAKPGTSNHGWGTAVDLGVPINSYASAQHQWMVATGPQYGWIHPYWARQGGGKEEPWHFEFSGAPGAGPGVIPATSTGASMFILINNVAGHALNGNAWVVIPQGAGKPRASGIGGQDVAEGVPTLTVKWATTWTKLEPGITWA